MSAIGFVLALISSAAVPVTIAANDVDAPEWLNQLLIPTIPVGPITGTIAAALGVALLVTYTRWQPRYTHWFSIGLSTLAAAGFAAVYLAAHALLFSAFNTNRVLIDCGSTEGGSDCGRSSLDPWFALLTVGIVICTACTVVYRSSLTASSLSRRQRRRATLVFVLALLPVANVVAFVLLPAVASAHRSVRTPTRTATA